MSEFLSALIKAAPKIFVWVSFSPAHTAYIQVTKSAIVEYLDSLEAVSIQNFYIETTDDGELYLGRPPQEEI